MIGLASLVSTTAEGAVNRRVLTSSRIECVYPAYQTPLRPFHQKSGCKSSEQRPTSLGNGTSQLPSPVRGCSPRVIHFKCKPTKKFYPSDEPLSKFHACGGKLGARCSMHHSMTYYTTIVLQ